MGRNWKMWRIGTWALGLCLLSCAPATRLAEVPTLYRSGTPYPGADVHPLQRSSRPTIFYVTDRAPIAVDEQVVGYSFERSSSMAFGASWVVFGQDLAWEDLVRESSQASGQGLILTNEGFQEFVRFSDTPIPFAVTNGKIQTLDAAEVAYAAQIEEFKEAFLLELARAPRKDALIYVHGFNNQFSDGITTVASMWHYAGRFGVPISYSWPAGNPGLFKYIKDRESGEFSIFHLKEFLRMLASIPELENIHIIAHSRGADVVLSAMREMIIYERGGQRNPRETLKVKNLIIAAPDLDLEVAEQRVVSERISGAVGQLNMYINPNDGALGLAQRLATGTRIGRLSPEDLDSDQSSFLGQLDNVHFINVEDAGRRLGHAYFRRNPSVSRISF